MRCGGSISAQLSHVNSHSLYDRCMTAAELWTMRTTTHALDDHITGATHSSLWRPLSSARNCCHTALRDGSEP